MDTPFQFVRGAIAGALVARRALAFFLAGIAMVCPLVALAQDAPPGAVGRVEGRDISVENGTAAGKGTLTTALSIYVSNGSVVTVHSGQGRMTLFAGGTVEICGPAKFTILLSQDAITLALNFGRVRVQLPEKTTLHVFTPTIIGTPIGISGAARDVTVGLNLDDSLCVAASSGAIQLEHQFTGERLIVPQSGEFFLNGGRLLPVAGTPGSCQCAEPEPRVMPAPGPPPEFAMAPAPLAELQPRSSVPATEATPNAPADIAPIVVPSVAPKIEFSIPANANQEHPVVQAAKESAPAAPPSTPIYTVVLPPLSFMANSPTPPPTPTADMALLVREAQVSPEYQFSGRVEVPEFAQEMQHALGQHPQEQHAKAASERNTEPNGKKRGFWASLKRVFGGG